MKYAVEVRHQTKTEGRNNMVLLSLRDRWADGLGQADEQTRNRGLAALTDLVEECRERVCAPDACFVHNLLLGVERLYGQHVSRFIAGNPRDEEVIFLCESWLAIGSLCGAFGLRNLPRQADQCIRFLDKVQPKPWHEFLRVRLLVRDCRTMLEDVNKRVDV
jgi:hypothetical protein